MPARTLRSWKLSKSTEPFYPFGVRCIGSGNSCAVTTWSAHKLEMLLFRNFNEAVRRDEPAKNVCTHPSPDTDCIADVVVGGQNSVVLMQSGILKYFESRKKLVPLEYLQDVRALCSCADGFAMIRVAGNGTEIFIDFHPDTFPCPDNGDDARNRQYDMSFDKNGAFSTWNDTHFLIKELPLAKVSENMAFLRLLLPDGAVDDSIAHILRPTLIVIDHNLLSFHVNADDGSHCVHQLISCSAKIVNFWMADRENAIFILLDSGAIECLAFNTLEHRLNSQKIYLRACDEIVASDFGNGTLAYSDGHRLYYGTISSDLANGHFQFHSRSERVCGVVALSIVRESDLILCISENNVFYVIPLAATATEDTQQWTEIDADAQDNLKLYQHSVFEMNDMYINLCREMILQNAMGQTALLRATHEANQPFFVAKVTAYRTLPSHLSTHPTVFVTNNMTLDCRSYFVRIALVPARYSSEFDSPIWNLRIRWCDEHDRRAQQSYVNIKLVREALLKPLDIMLHMQQNEKSLHLPELRLEINTPIKIGPDFLYINFPVRVEQAQIRDLIEIHSTKPNLHGFNRKEIELSISSFRHFGRVPTTKNLLHKIQLPSAIAFDQIVLHNDFKQHIRPSLQANDKQSPCNYHFVILSSTLEMTYNRSAHNIILTTTNAAILFYIKKLIYRIVIDCLPASRTYHLPVAVPNEYCNASMNVNSYFNAMNDNNAYKHDDILRSIDKARNKYSLWNI